MFSSVQTLLAFSSVFLGLMTDHIGSPCLSCENIAAMPLVSQNLDNCVGCPLGVAEKRCLAEFLKGLGNILSVNCDFIGCYFPKSVVNVCAAKKEVEHHDLCHVRYPWAEAAL